MEVVIGFFAIVAYFVPFILAFVNLGRVNSLTRRVALLERTIIAQQNDLNELRKGTEPIPAVPPLPRQEAPPAPPVKTPPVQPFAPAATGIAPGSPAQEPRPMFTPSAVPAFAQKTPAKTRTNKEWEALIGGKVLNRIGALALIIGMGFFLKYAFDNNWITETMRVALGGVAGAALLIVADRTRKKEFIVFSQGLIGAGVAILYLSVYAAFNFYHLVPQAAAFVMMSVVTMLTLWEAWRYESIAVAVLGWAGGFLTPVMLSTGAANEVGLFTYIALLDAGLLAVALSHERWIALEPLTFAGTAIIYALWFPGSYNPADLSTTVFYLTLFWLLFFVLEALRNVRSINSSLYVRHPVAVLNAMLYLVAMFEVIDPARHSCMGPVTLLMGAPYAVMFLKLRPKGERSIVERYVLIAIAFLFAATAIQCEGFVTVAVWSVEAGVILWLGVSAWNLRSVWLASLVIFVFAFFKLVFSTGALQFEPLEEFRLLVNMRALAFALLAVSMYWSAELLIRHTDKYAPGAGKTVAYAACLVGLILAAVETLDLFDRWMLYAAGDSLQMLAYKRNMTLGMVFIASGVFLTWAGTRRRTDALFHSGIFAAALALCIGIFVGASYEPIALFSPVLNFRMLGLLLLLSGFAVQVLLWRKENAASSNAWKEVLLGGLYLSIVVLVLVLLTAETRDYFEQKIHFLNTMEWTHEINSRIQEEQNAKQLSLSGVWLLYSIVLMAIGLWRRLRSLRIVSIVLFGATILKIFIYDLSFLQTLYRIFSFIGLGLILLAVSYLYQKYRSIILETENSSRDGRTNP